MSGRAGFTRCRRVAARRSRPVHRLPHVRNTCLSRAGGEGGGGSAVGGVGLSASSILAVVSSPVVAPRGRAPSVDRRSPPLTVATTAITMTPTRAPPRYTRSVRYLSTTSRGSRSVTRPSFTPRSRTRASTATLTTSALRKGDLSGRRAEPVTARGGGGGGEGVFCFAGGGGGGAGGGTASLRQPSPALDRRHHRREHQPGRADHDRDRPLGGAERVGAQDLLGDGAGDGDPLERYPAEQADDEARVRERAQLPQGTFHERQPIACAHSKATSVVNAIVCAWMTVEFS